MSRRKRKKKAGQITVVALLLLIIFLCLGFWILTQIVDISPVKNEVLETVKKSVIIAQEAPVEKVPVSEDDVSSGYYYQQLSEEEQTLYKELYQGILDFSNSIQMQTSDIEIIKKINSCVYSDRPELFWGTGNMQINGYVDYAEVQVKYTIEAEERELRQAQIDAEVATCLSNITDEMSEYDKIKYVFEYIVNTVEYNLDAPDNQNIYSVFVGKTSVCAGYSRAAQYLLQKIGIECIYVTGSIPGQGPHAWNIVNCDGQYYQMDVTFGDPVFLESESGASMPEQSINYDYLCCSDAEIYKNHSADSIVTFPSCTSMDLNYYKLNGMYYEEFQPDQLLQDMNHSIYTQASSFTCKFASDGIYQEAKDVILNDLVQRAAQNLLAYYGLNSATYNYVEEDTMNRITIYWSYQ